MAALALPAGREFMFFGARARQRGTRAPLALGAGLAGLTVVGPALAGAPPKVGPPMQTGPENTLGGLSDSEIWGAIRHEAFGIATSQRPEDGVLIDADGWWWTELRMPSGPLVQGAIWFLLIVILAILLFAIVRGRIRLEGGRAGIRIPRFSLTQRVVHWTVAALFIIMALSGLVILFGRPLLIPVFGHGATSVMASAAMQAHNLMGPVFAVSILTLFATFLPGNLPSQDDIGWILKGGGLFGGHPHAGRYNAGEKSWFWTATLAGVVLSVSGILMLFPDNLAPWVAELAYGFPRARDLLHLAEIGHVVAAVIMIGFALGHIYLGTYGNEGAFEGMVDGTVDLNWAREHHDLWAGEMSGGSAGTGAAAEPAE